VLSDGESKGETSGNAMSSTTNHNNDHYRSSLLSSTPSFIAPTLQYQPLPSERMQSGSFVNFTPLPGKANVNPAMELASGRSSQQVINVLDMPQASNNLSEVAMTDSGYLEGIPGGMFDWGRGRNWFLNGNLIDFFRF
jgi:hypothetical protein